MGCGCSKPRDNTLAGKRLRAEQNLVVDDHGLFPLASAPSCTEGYHGAFPSATVYVCDRGGSHERFFVRKQYDEAQAHARRHDLSLVHVAAAQLCHETMLAFLGA